MTLAAASGGGGSNSHNSHHRKMRRSREAAAPSDDSLSGYDLFSVQGDAAGAYDLLFAADEADSGAGNSNSNAGTGTGTGRGAGNSPSFVKRYNRLVLSSLVGSSEKNSAGDSGEGLWNEMSRMDEELRSSSNNNNRSSIPPRKKRRNELIVAFNRALVAFARGRRTEAEETCAALLLELMQPPAAPAAAAAAATTNNNKTNSINKPPDEYAMVASRVAFLWLECRLARSVGPTSGEVGAGDDSPVPAGRQMPKLEGVVGWLEAFDSERDPQLKFLLNLYRSRLDLAALDGSGRHDDARIRAARKELKQAMDVLQHKLRPTFGAEGAGSVVSSANSEENTCNSASLAAAAAATGDNPQPAPGSVVLQRHNRAALSLKANSEQLKGNTKKSLILCGEAHAAVTSPNNGGGGGAGGGGGGDASHEALHENNLAIIYGTIGKRHLALHAMTKALRAASAGAGSGGEPHPAFFFRDGTARPDPTLTVLHNAAICALQARNYGMAYRCMAVCVARSDVFRGRPRCWLRLAEACVGVYADERHRRKSHGQPLFTPVHVGGEPKGILVDNAVFDDHPKLANEVPAPLATAEDFDQVERNPLVRARASLEHVVESKDPVGNDVLASARLTLSYIHLAFDDYRSALEMAKLVLSSPEPAHGNDDVTRRCHKRRIATARMYAAESSCILGAPVDAMKFLVGDGQDDAFDRLASDLGGVTIETAATNGKGKCRLARAQTAVRSSASAVTADLGNLTAAKQLAMSAQAMEDAYESNRERSLSRRALAYALLKSGNHGAALSLLRSLR